MAIKSDASHDEESSPYYIDNKKTCDTFEAFILSKSGQTKGKYNAWSYIATGKIPHKNQWYFTIKKTSLTSGNLILSSKYQSLQYYGKWLAKEFISDCPPFKIFRHKWTDFLLDPSAKKTHQFPGYCILSENKEHQLIIDLLDLLETMLTLKKYGK